MNGNNLYKISNLLMIKNAGSAQKSLFQFIASIITNTSFQNITYASGGFVRDKVKDIESNDLDLVVQKEGGSKELCQFILKLLDGFVIYEKLNANYPTYNLKFKSNIQLHNHIYNTIGADVDISDTALKRFSQDSGKQKLFIFGNLYQDAMQRDFTMNSLFQNLITKQIIDPTNYGMTDIKNNLLRMIPNIDKQDTLFNNPKIMLRYCRFFANFQMNIIKDDIFSMKNLSYRIQTLDEQHIIKQINKIHKDKIEKSIQMMKLIGIWKYISKYFK